MSQKPSNFVNACRIALAICVLGFFVNGSQRSKLNRKMEPFVREHATINSAPYQALSFLEGYAHGYTGNYAAGADQIKREYMRENHIQSNINDLHKKWKSANRWYYLSIWGAVISGILWGIGVAAASPQVTREQ